MLVLDMYESHQIELVSEKRMKKKNKTHTQKEPTNNNNLRSMTSQ